MIESVQFKNVRSLADTGRIPLKKINVLVGKNSSGKSTFLRMFPLLRQSVEVETKSPLLWYGRLVDFGSFPVVLRDQVGIDYCSVGFSLKRVGAPVRPPGSARAMIRSFGGLARPLTDIHCELELGSGAAENVGAARGIRLRFWGDDIYIPIKGFSVRSINVNGREFSPGAGRWFKFPGRLFPEMTLANRRMDDKGEEFFAPDTSYLIDEIAKQLHKLCHGNTSDDTLNAIAQTLLFDSADRFFAQIVNHPNAPSSLVSGVLAAGGESKELESIRLLVLCAALAQIVRELDAAVSDFAGNVKYIEPLRASAERYYRLQDLAVDEIDSRGSNTAMLLHSLDEGKRAALRDWMNSHLGFHAYTQESEGHVAVKIATANGEGKNIADLGFGYSQLLPIVLQLWMSIQRPSRLNFGSYRQAGKQQLIAMEQPELHLHPHYQALVADVLAAVVNVEGGPRVSPPSIILETHSEHLVNRLGQLISDGVLEPDDVSVLVFNQEDGESSITSVDYDEQGVLSDSWPVGFFIPEA